MRVSSFLPAKISDKKPVKGDKKMVVNIHHPSESKARRLGVEDWTGRVKLGWIRPGLIGINI